MIASRPALTALRLAALAAACGRLYLSDLRPASDWALGIEPAIVGSALASLAVALEPRASLRRAMFVLLVVAHALRMLHDDGTWHDEPFWTDAVVWTGVESIVLFAFIETRLWRWWPMSFVPLTAWFLYHLIPAPYPRPAIVAERAAWLFQAWLLLVTVVSFRMLDRHRADDAADQLGSIGDDVAH